MKETRKTMSSQMEEKLKGLRVNALLLMLNRKDDVSKNGLVFNSFHLPVWDCLVCQSVSCAQDFEVRFDLVLYAILTKFCYLSCHVPRWSGHVRSTGVNNVAGNYWRITEGFSYIIPIRFLPRYILWSLLSQQRCKSAHTLLNGPIEPTTARQCRLWYQKK